MTAHAPNRPQADVSSALKKGGARPQDAAAGALAFRGLPGGPQPGATAEPSTRAFLKLLCALTCLPPGPCSPSATKFQQLLCEINRL